MISDTESIATFIARATERHKTLARPQSKLEPYRAEILGAAKERLPVTTISAVLQEMYGLTVSASNLSRWIKRQQDFKKAKVGVKKPMSKERQAAWDKIANRDPNEPLTL